MSPMHMLGTIGLLIALAVRGVVSSQEQSRSPGDLLEQLNRAEATWRANKVSAYEFRFQYACNGLIPPDPQSSKPLLFRLKDGESTLSAAPTPHDLQLYATVEGQFAFIRESLERRPYRMSVQYDPRLGYPTRVCVNQTAASDDGRGFLITDFKTLSK